MKDTTKTDASQVAQKLRHLADVVERLETVGLRIIAAEANLTRFHRDDALVSMQLPGGLDAFRAWLRETGTPVRFEIWDVESDLPWLAKCIVDEVDVVAYLTEEDKNYIEKEDEG